MSIINDSVPNKGNPQEYTTIQRPHDLVLELVNSGRWKELYQHSSAWQLRITMSILVLGGRGKTATHLAILLQQHNISFVVASRNPTESGSFQHLRFDWLDESTYDNVIAPGMDRIRAIYMVAPEVPDCLTPMKRFIDHARQRGAKRFVLLSSSAIAAGGPFFGKVHEYLCTLEVEYSVLRPSWFQGMPNHRTLDENYVS